jgi:hypothetical protein
MGKNIAVDGCELEDVTGGGTVSITSTPSQSSLADGKGIFFGPVSISVSQSNGGGSITDGNGAGAGTITGSDNNHLENGQPALLEGDTATIQVTGTTTPPGGSPTPVGPIPVTVRVKKAGQDKVIAL